MLLRSHALVNKSDETSASTWLLISIFFSSPSSILYKNSQYKIEIGNQTTEKGGDYCLKKAPGGGGGFLPNF